MADLVRELGGPAGFGENALPPNDDQSSPAVDITSVFPDGLNFFGTSYQSLFINNNGNITFESPIGTFTPFGITDATFPIIAAFFADVDTRGDETGLAPTPGGTSQGTDTVWYDLDPTTGTFTVTWDDVGVFSADLSMRNAFQLQLVDSGDGDFDIIYRYEEIEWTVGSASAGEDARIGYSAGDGENVSELSASGDRAALLGLPESEGINSSESGEVSYRVRAGVVEPIEEEPTPAGGFGVIEDPDEAPTVGDGGTNGDGDTIEVPDTPAVAGERVIGTGESDTLLGSAGDDTIGGAAGDDAINAGGGDDVVKGGAGSDGIDGGAGNDIIRGNAGTDRIIGGTGDDTLLGGTQDDTLIGRGGDELIRGGLGDDLIFGGRGRDVVAGDAGADVFVLTTAEGQSRIIDFEVHVDSFALDGGLTFADLTLAGNEILAGEDVLAVVLGVDTAGLTAEDFTLL